MTRRTPQIHDIDVLRWLLGDPVQLTAHTANRFGHDGIEDTAAVQFTYADGSVAQLTSIWHQVLTRESSRRLEVTVGEVADRTFDGFRALGRRGRVGGRPCATCSGSRRSSIG